MLKLNNGASAKHVLKVMLILVIIGGAIFFGLKKFKVQSNELPLDVTTTLPKPEPPNSIEKPAGTTWNVTASPLEQAKWLLRPVGKYGQLGAPLGNLPEPLKGLIGKPVTSTISKDALVRFLLLNHIQNESIGGSINAPLSTSQKGEPARYFIIHDTSSPTLEQNQSFPPANMDTPSWSGNNLNRHTGGPENKRKAHVFVNRLGESGTAVDFQKPWRATKYEKQSADRRGLFLSIELIQPRRKDSKGIDSEAPIPGFTVAQLDRLALLYVVASVRGGEWLIPAFHAAVDADIPNAHDDPQNFDLNLWVSRLDLMIKTIQAQGTETPSQLQVQSQYNPPQGTETPSQLQVQSQYYNPPKDSFEAVKTIPWALAKPVGERFRQRFQECDTKDTCNGKKLTYGCRKDQNHNTALLRFPDGTIFFDGKMGVDADGSPISRKKPHQTDQPETSFYYDLPGKQHVFVNADKVPFIVIPLGGFDKELGIEVGDVAAVVYQGKVVYALVADQGPSCKIGEGSIELHEQLGHKVCQDRNKQGECIQYRDSGIKKDVLYFIFPGSIRQGLTPENANQRIHSEGEKRFKALQGK